MDDTTDRVATKDGTQTKRSTSQSMGRWYESIAAYYAEHGPWRRLYSEGQAVVESIGPYLGEGFLHTSDIGYPDPGKPNADNTRLQFLNAFSNS